MAIAFIPVRGGSKSIPFKNIKPFCGKPLVYWCIKALQESTKIDKIVVSTDSEEIRKVVSEFGFGKVELFNRSSDFATDTASTEDAILEYLSEANVIDSEHFILVQATNPFLFSADSHTSDIDQAIDLMKKEGADSLLSCVRSKRFFWDDDGKPLNYDYHRRPRRQDFEGVFMENGAFYISIVNNILKDKSRLSGKIAIYQMPEYTSFEIDEPDDWIIMEELFSKYVLKKKLQHEPSNNKKIRLFVCDVDGVLTDAGMYYSEEGDELKKFNTLDGMAFQILRERGVKTGIITSENTKIVERRAKKIKADYLFQGKGFGSKLSALTEICQRENISIDDVAYIGDDINCMDILQAVGVKACPENATKPIRSINGILELERRGGEGVVREFVDWLINNNYC